MNVNEQNQVEASKHINYDMGPIKLSTQNFAGVIVLWLIGMIICVVAFGAELAWFRLGKRIEDNHIWAKKHGKIIIQNDDKNLD